MARGGGLLDIEIDLDAGVVGDVDQAELQRRLLAGFEAGHLREALRPAFAQARGGAAGEPPPIFVTPPSGEPPPVLPSSSEGAESPRYSAAGAGAAERHGRSGDQGVGIAGWSDGGSGVLGEFPGLHSDPDASEEWGGDQHGGFGHGSSGSRGGAHSDDQDMYEALAARHAAAAAARSGDAAPGPQDRMPPPHPGPGPVGAERARIQRSIWELNHPTTPVSPSFLADNSYWHQRAGHRRRELRLQEDLRNLRRSEAGEPFHAAPPPVATTAPRFRAMQAAEAARRGRSVELSVSRRRARSADGGGGRRPASRSDAHAFAYYGPASAAARARASSASPTRWGGRNALEAREDSPPPFRARPAPLTTAAPLYEQRQSQERQSREERHKQRCEALLKTSSLPPRLEAMRARFLAEEAAKAQKAEEAKKRGTVEQLQARHPRYGSARHLSRPPVPSPQALPPEAPPEPPAPPQPGSVGPFVQPGFLGLLSEDPLAASVLGDALGIIGGAPAAVATEVPAPAPGQRTTPKLRREAADRNVPVLTYRTGEVPDFASLHEKGRKQLERRKMMNRRKTPPAPFQFHAPDRRERPQRQPPLPKDPAQDWRFCRARARTSSGTRTSAGDGAGDGAGAPGGGWGAAAAMVPPPRTTIKTAQSQMVTVMKLIEDRRREEERKQQEFSRANDVSVELKMRVRQCVGPSEPVEDKIERMAMHKRLNSQRVVCQQLSALERIKERVERRPLLMEQTDGPSRARRRALFKVRQALEGAGVRNADGMFEDDELDELERATEREAARTAKAAARAADLVDRMARSVHE